MTKVVYMVQPPGFKDTTKPNLVCRLRNAIYSLKHLGQNSKAYNSLFIYKDASIICYFLVYVDDLVITGNNSSFVASIIAKLGIQLSLKDMGPLHFFLRVEIIPTSAGIFLS